MASANSTKLGTLLDKLWAKRWELTKAKSAAKKLEKEFNMLQEQVFRDFKKADIEGAFGKDCRAKINPREVPTIKDWKAFTAYLIRTRGTDLIQKRINREAWLERLAQGKKVPGVESFQVLKLSLTKKK